MSKSKKMNSEFMFGFFSWLFRVCMIKSSNKSKNKKIHTKKKKYTKQYDFDVN